MISSHSVLTAAHCKISPLLHYAKLASGTRLRINSVVSSDTGHDLAVVRVMPTIASPVTTLGHVDPTNSMVTALGWGAINTNNFSASGKLRWLNMTLFDQRQCEVRFQPHVNNQIHLCASGNDTQGVCFGDSGSPMFQVQQKSKVVTIGIASFVLNGCAAGSHIPDVFTRIDTARSFIDAHAEGTLWTTSRAVRAESVLARAWSLFILVWLVMNNCKHH